MLKNVLKNKTQQKLKMIQNQEKKKKNISRHETSNEENIQESKQKRKKELKLKILKT